MTFDGQEVKVLNIDSAKAVGIAHINGTVATINFIVNGTARDGFFCSRVSGNYGVGDTRWQYNYYYSYDGSAWTLLASNSAATNFVIEVASGTTYIHLRADVVNHQTYRNYTYQSGSHLEGKSRWYGANTLEKDLLKTEFQWGVNKKSDPESWHYSYTVDSNARHLLDTIYNVSVWTGIVNQLKNGRWYSGPFVEFVNSSKSTRYIWLVSGWYESILGTYQGTGYALAKNTAITYPTGDVWNDNALAKVVADYTTIQRWETT